MVRYILDKLGTDVEVVLKVDQVMFRSGDVYEQIVPVVYIAEQASKYRVWP